MRPNEKIGNEAHPDMDQFFRIEEGTAGFVFDDKEDHLVGNGSVVAVLAGT
ncbi:MAG: hypothetical protein ACLPX5_15875 [Dissulfurispiraceae bacterium]